ncbi:hypothetical protein [Cetobacterium sp.]|uniref:hypothetical protein n=1 Tax=Cetobacterium sp. TaxID=2071632 RepID=UPI003F2B0C7F
MGYYQDRDFENWLDTEFQKDEMCSSNKCQGCITYYKCHKIEDTQEEKDFYMVVASGMYLMSHKKNGKWFTKDKNKARKFKKKETAVRHMKYMGTERYNIV